MKTSDHLAASAVHERFDRVRLERLLVPDEQWINGPHGRHACQGPDRPPFVPFVSVNDFCSECNHAALAHERGYICSACEAIRDMLMSRL